MLRSLTHAFTPQYLNHAHEVNMAIPTVPVLFMKPSTALADPHPAPTVIPKAFVKDDAADYESEVAVVIGKACKNVSEEEAMDYVLGYVPSLSTRTLWLISLTSPLALATLPQTTSPRAQHNSLSRNGATASPSTVLARSVRHLFTRTPSRTLPSSRSAAR